MIKKKIINDVKIKIIKPSVSKPLRESHQKIFGHTPYGMVLLLGSRGTGKSTVLYNLITHICQPKYTRLVIISSTAGIGDRTWETIIEKLGRGGVNFSIHNDIENIDKIIDNLIEEARARFDEGGEGKLYKLMMNPLESEKKKSKYEVIDYIVVFDDCSKYIRSQKRLELLCKTLRHYNSFIFIATQSLVDLSPPLREAANFSLLFAGMGEKRLKIFYDEKINKISQEDFEELYNTVTSVKYNFLFIDVDNQKFRINLNEEIILN